MLPALNQSASRATRHSFIVLGALGVIAIAVPTLSWTALSQTAEHAGLNLADAGETGEAGQGESHARHNEKPLAKTKTKGDRAAVEVEYFPRPTKAEERILEALDRPTTVEFIDLPLEDCLTYLMEYHDNQNDKNSNPSRLAIYLDKPTLTDEGVAHDQPINLKLNDLRLESVLNLLLDPIQLTFLIEDEVLKITTKAKAGEKLMTRTYPVLDLYRGRDRVAAESIRKGPRAAATEQTEKSDNGNSSGDIAKDTKDSKGTKVAPPLRFDDLEEAIIATIQPDSWEEVSGPGSLTYVKESGSLVIRQTLSVHRDILQLLRDLREAKRLGPSASVRGLP